MIAWVYVLAFWLGSVPFGLLVARSRGIDIRQVGSGNIGATNVHRALGKRAGIAVFVLDVLKGLLPAVAVRLAYADYGPIALGDYALSAKEAAFLAGAAAMLGHMFSPFLRFRGGKGISTALGAALGADPVVALLAFTVFAGVVASTRYISLGSLVAVPAAVVLAWWFDSGWVLIGAFALLTVFVYVRHSGNIARLRAGTESRFSWSRSKEGG